MTFGANLLVDDHYSIANNYFSDLLFETGQFDFVSTPDVTLTDGWITRMAPGASYTYAFGRLRSKLGPSKPRPYQSCSSSIASIILSKSPIRSGVRPAKSA